MILQERDGSLTDRLESRLGFLKQMGSYRLKGNRNKGDILPRIREFHDALFEHYRETMSGDRNLLFRMKDLELHAGRSAGQRKNSPKDP